MILPDVNLLIYAYNQSDPRFKTASNWFQNIMNGQKSVCFCWETINGFIRIVTNKAAVPYPYTLGETFQLVDEWLAFPNTIFLKPSNDHFELIKKLALDTNAAGTLYPDAVIAAYAISYNATIASCDRDFRLFDGIKLIDPLAI